MSINNKICVLLFLYFFSLSLNCVNCLGNLENHSILYGISSLVSKESNYTKCEDDLKVLFNSVENKEFWAIKALDSSGVPGPGFIYGNNLWLGSHAQCTDIGNHKKFEVNYAKNHYPIKSDKHDFPPFPMGFSVIYLRHNSSLQFHTQLPLEFIIQLGLCVPNSCRCEKSGVLKTLLERYVKKGEMFAFPQLYNATLKVQKVRNLDHEDAKEPLMTQPKTIMLIAVSSVATLFVIIGTVYDVRSHNISKNSTLQSSEKIYCKNELNNNSNTLINSTKTQCNSSCGIFWRIAKCFSIYTNVKSLVKTDLGPDSVPIIHGLRFFGMLWVIMVHSVFYQADYLENISIAYRLSEDVFAQILSNSTYCVDTYFFLSGFLVAYLFFNKKQSDNSKSFVAKLNEYCMMFLGRFLRLTPPYVIVLLFTNVMYSYYYNTSSMISSERADLLCSKYWWRNLLYINNLFPRSEMCMSWSWYLSIDTQFFAITTLLLIISTTYFNTAVILTIALVLISIICTTLTSYSIGYIPTLDEQLSQLDAIYDLPWNRIGPYLVGSITAYILVRKLRNKLTIKEPLRILLWILFPLLNLWILFTLYTRNLSVEFSAVYMGVSRTLWGVGLGWLLIACCTGNARALENFLAFKGWIPLSRLTYSAYLLNPIISNMLYLSSERSYNASIASFILSVQGVCMSTFFVALILSLFFEVPSILLTKIVFEKMSLKSRKVENGTKHMEVV